MTQKFRGDPDELSVEAAVSPALMSVSAGLDDYFAGCYTSADFLLMLYDAGRMPFSDRVPRDSFVNFVRQAIPNFPFLGSFESYLFIVKSIFGEDAEIFFTVPGPGKLTMVINVAGAGLDFTWVSKQFSGEEFTFFDMVTDQGDSILLRGISGIQSEAELKQLLSELIPAGIYPDITLTFFVLTEWAAEDHLGDISTIIDYLGNEIVFYEEGV